MSVAVPLRVSVIGSSAALRTADSSHGMRQVYARQLQRLLSWEGRPSDVENFGRPRLTVSGAVCNWEETVMARSPDIVILHLGAIESDPRAVPGPRGPRRWLARPMTARRFQWELRHFLGMTFGVGRPLVLMLELPALRGHGPHSRVGRRRAQIQQAIENAAGIFEGARVVRVSPLLDVLGHNAAMPDGVHFSSSMHLAVAELLLEEIRSAGVV